MEDIYVRKLVCSVSDVQTGAYTFPQDNFIARLDASATSPTATLPPCSATVLGECKIVALMTVIGAGQTATVLPHGSDTINGAASLAIVDDYGCVRLMSDGVSKWTLI